MLNSVSIPKRIALSRSLHHHCTILPTDLFANTLVKDCFNKLTRIADDVALFYLHELMKRRLSKRDSAIKFYVVSEYFVLTVKSTMQ